MIAARRLTTTPEEERVKDVWDLGVFGLGEKRAMDFTRASPAVAARVGEGVHDRAALEPEAADRAPRRRVDAAPV